MITDRSIDNVLPDRTAAKTVIADAAHATSMLTINDPWQLYLSRPELAYALAHKRISREASRSRSTQSSDLGWAYLTSTSRSDSRPYRVSAPPVGVC